jgi:hypothetical protein
MNTQLRSIQTFAVSAVLLAVHAAALAQTAPSSPAPAATGVLASQYQPPATDPDKTEPGEPAVQQTVIEDDNARIDELKVRGRSQRISVKPKTAGRPYEIITNNGSRDLTEGPNGFNGAVGKRVWPVMSF